jgi:MGT family glycosyltransferase
VPAAVLDPTPPSWRHGYGPDGLKRLAIRSVAWSDPGGTVPAALLDGEGGEKRTAAYLTLGTVSFGAVEILRRSILEAATRCPQVIVAAGPESDPALLGDLPPNVHVERLVDQARVLDRVRVAVHHGGTGTTLGCLAAGVPQVITPQGADHVLNAGRLAELGLGAVVDNDAPPGALGDALDRVLGDPALLQRVQAVRDEVAAMPHPEQVVETLDARFGH